MVEITASYLASQGLSETFPERFWAKVNKTESCWLWTACTDRGYGCISSGIKGGMTVSAPRGSWILCVGPIPDNLCVLHNCPTGDNPRCVNPDHLWLGDRTQNMKDKIAKGRQLYGEQVGTHKLTQSKVDEIRNMWKTERFTMQLLADKFGISLAAVFKIVRHKMWKGRPHPGIPS